VLGVDASWAWEHHTPGNIAEEIEYAVKLDTDFHQFMLYTPLPGTPFGEQMEREGRLLEDTDYADIHGSTNSTGSIRTSRRDESKELLDGAFRRDYERNGPSLYRLCRTTLEGWKRYRRYPDLRVRERSSARRVR